jgi:hypothetical protein
MFGDIRPGGRHLEDLASFDRHDLCIGEIPLAGRAALWPVRDHLVGVGHLRQVMAFVAGLLARPALGLATFGPVGRRLGQSLG